MSRSGYVEDYDGEDIGALNLYRASVRRSFNGKRGQAFMRNMADVLDAMPVKKLAATTWVEGGNACALGAVAESRSLRKTFTTFDPEDDSAAANAARLLNIAECMAREIVYVNDDCGPHEETDEERWVRMRAWVEKKLAFRKAAP